MARPALVGLLLLSGVFASPLRSDAASDVRVVPRVSADDQQGSALQLALPAADVLVSTGPMLTTNDVLDDRDMRRLITNGFPAWLHYRVELWSRGGWFDDPQRAVEWEVSVRYEPLTRTYRVTRYLSPDRVQTLGRFTEYSDAAAAVRRPFRVPLPAQASGRRQYYSVVLEVAALSNSDLDELERWFRGELRPSLRGDADPSTAFGRAFRTLMTRLLGGQKRTYVMRSATFRTQ